jgi:hypothetical protein
MLGAARYRGGDERRFLMSSIMSVLQSSYSTAATPSLISPGDKFAPVNAASYQGTWTGKDYQNQPVTVSITKVSGYRANVTLQTSAGLQFHSADHHQGHVSNRRFPVQARRKRFRDNKHDRDQCYHRHPNRESGYPYPGHHPLTFRDEKRPRSDVPARCRDWIGQSAKVAGCREVKRTQPQVM